MTNEIQNEGQSGSINKSEHWNALFIAGDAVLSSFKIEAGLDLDDYPTEISKKAPFKRRSALEKIDEAVAYILNIVSPLIAENGKLSEYLQNNIKQFIIAIRRLPEISKITADKLSSGHDLTNEQFFGIYDFTKEIINAIEYFGDIIAQEKLDSLYGYTYEINDVLFDDIMSDYNHLLKSLQIKNELAKASDQIVAYVVRSIRLVEDGDRVDRINNMKEQRSQIDQDNILLMLENVFSKCIKELNLSNLQKEFILPDAPPNNEKYDVQSTEESAPVFIERVYKNWLTGEFTRADLRKIDPKAEMALRNWERLHGRASLNLPNKKETNDKGLAESDDGVDKHDKLDRQRLRATRRQNFKRHITPLTPPNGETFDKRPNGEDAPSFIQRVYGKWLTGEFTRADLRKIDAKADMGLYNWERLHGRAQLNLPTKKERNDQLLARIGEEKPEAAKLHDALRARKRRERSLTK